MCSTLFTPSRNVVQTLFAALLLLVMVACGGSVSDTNHGPNLGGNPPPPNQPSATLSAIILILTTSPGIAVGGTVQTVANAEYRSDTNVFTYKDVTQTATWSTSNSAVATVTNGLVSGVGIGRATITVSFGSRTSTTLVVVGQTPSLVIKARDYYDGNLSQFSLSRPALYFELLASYPDGSELNLARYATWSSSSPEVLEFIENGFESPGDAFLVATGTAIVAATLSTGEVTSMEVTVVP
jgi:hypothetical protein